MDNKPKYSKVRWEERNQIYDSIREQGTLSHLVWPLSGDKSISDTLLRIYDRGLEREHALKKVGLGGSYMEFGASYSLHVTSAKGGSDLEYGDFSLGGNWWGGAGAVVFNKNLNEKIKQEQALPYEVLEYLINHYVDNSNGWAQIKKEKAPEVEDILKNINIFANKLKSLNVHNGIGWFLFSSYVLRGNYDLPHCDKGIRAMTLDSEREIVPMYSIKPEYISHIFEPIRET